MAHQQGQVFIAVVAEWIHGPERGIDHAQQRLKRGVLFSGHAGIGHAPAQQRIADGPEEWVGNDARRPLSQGGRRAGRDLPDDGTVIDGADHAQVGAVAAEDFERLVQVVRHDVAAHRTDRGGVDIGSQARLVGAALRIHVAQPDASGRREARRQREQLRPAGHIQRLGAQQRRRARGDGIARSAQVDELAERVDHAQPQEMQEAGAHHDTRRRRGIVGAGLADAIGRIAAPQLGVQPAERPRQHVDAIQRGGDVFEG